ncbi:MAG: sigma-70 family RNA polymerase sigma factor [Acidobacteria bacterium]|nr:sigma-70 family RNA polymerase sigma factor [Acidobacteriota bacterium]
MDSASTDQMLHLVQAAVAQTQPLRRSSPELAFYRKYTEAMLRRYVRMSMEAGRVPSMLGRELFRAKVTNYEVHSFEDVVIFVCDVERCLGLMDDRSQKLLRRIAMQQYTQWEVAATLGISERTVMRWYNESLDKLTAIFLERSMLQQMD